MSSLGYRLPASIQQTDLDTPSVAGRKTLPAVVTEFGLALLQYRSALEAAASTAVGVEQHEILSLLFDGLDLIEQRYAETSDPKWCWVYIESEQVFFDVNILRGPGVPALRAAFNRLSELILERLMVKTSQPSGERC